MNCTCKTACSHYKKVDIYYYDDKNKLNTNYYASLKLIQIPWNITQIKQELKVITFYVNVKNNENVNF
jgi:hypothetical protein